MRIPLALGSLVLTLGVATPATAQLPLSTTGDVLVSSFGNNKVLRLAHDGTQLAEFTFPGLTGPRGIATTESGRVFLVSQSTNEVLELDRNLALVNRFPTQLALAPTGLAIGPNGNLFVAGFNTSNVIEYELDGTVVGGYQWSGLKFSNCVAFAPDGSFFVASAGNGSVVKFDAAGAPAGSFTGFGLSSPMGLAIWNGELFAAGGGSNNIVVFDLAGNALRQITHPDLQGPQGVAFTTDGELVTSGFFNNKIMSFAADGTHLWTTQPASSQVPRGLALLPSLSVETSGNPQLGTPFDISIQSPFEPGSAYLTAIALSQSPGTPLPDGRVWPLTPDSLFFTSLLSGPPLFQDFVGLLGSDGTADATLFFPNLPALSGLAVHAGAITVDPLNTSDVRQIAESVPLVFS